jgi:glyoxylase-like metal-dependent hydrolase (beta-lactamase superfamily II)
MGKYTILANHSFHFEIGSLKALVIRDSMSSEDWYKFFPAVKPAELHKAFVQHGFSNQGIMEIMCLFIKSGNHSILIDTGWGTWSQINTGKLTRILEVEGIHRQKIDTVIISHGHPDHIGGNVDAEGNPTFPNARYLMSRKEWDFWTSGPLLPKIDEGIRLTMLEAVKRNLIPIKDRFEFIDDETEILPGIESFKAPGHSPYQIGLSISSGGERLLCTFDVFHHPIQLMYPSWMTPFDLLPEQAADTRKQILSSRITPEMTVFACHFPFPGIGRVIKKGSYWSWQPTWGR